MTKSFRPLAAAAAAATCAALLGLSTAASAASLPTLKVALTGTTRVSVSSPSIGSGAVSLVSTFSGKAPSGPNANGPSVGIVKLDPGVTIQQAAGAVQSHHGDINALDPYGALIVSAGAPGTVQTVLTPGSYVALNITGNQPAFAPFTVTRAASPAALPSAAATEAAIEFGFHGPSVLRNGTLVRAENDGYLVHMVTLFGVKNRHDGMEAITLLKAGKDKQVQKLASNSFLSLLGPASHGAMQQQVLHAKPGYYVEACFMDTLDGREHTQLGMERLVRVVN